VFNDDENIKQQKCNNLSRMKENHADNDAISIDKYESQLDLNHQIKVENHDEMKFDRTRRKSELNNEILPKKGTKFKQLTTDSSITITEGDEDLKFEEQINNRKKEADEWGDVLDDTDHVFDDDLMQKRTMKIVNMPQSERLSALGSTQIIMRFEPAQTGTLGEVQSDWKQTTGINGILTTNEGNQFYYWI
jgi:hypothetical protein